METASLNLLLVYQQNPFVLYILFFLQILASMRRSLVKIGLVTILLKRRECMATRTVRAHWKISV